MIDPKTTMAVSSSVPFIGGETQLEIASDALLGVAFLVTAIVAGKRLQSSRQQVCAAFRREIWDLDDICRTVFVL